MEFCLLFYRKKRLYLLNRYKYEAECKMEEN